MLWRYLPLIGVIVFIVITFVWRPWLQARRHGTSGILLFRSPQASQIARDVVAVLWFVLLLGQAGATAVFPDWLARRALVTGPAIEIMQAAGAVLLFAGLALVVTAQLHLGAAWRIGIDDDARPGLVTTGLYRFSRNPIYLAFAVMMIGYALLIPTFLSLAMLIGTYIGVRRQISAEERYLARSYGEAWRDYAGRVGRFVPGIGRLR
jgi:protein-S-isoprenylcysteine O-methyltransferase Ste14